MNKKTETEKSDITPQSGVILNENYRKASGIIISNTHICADFEGKIDCPRQHNENKCEAFRDGKCWGINILPLYESNGTRIKLYLESICGMRMRMD